jgi:hypothetical protein
MRNFVLAVAAIAVMNLIGIIDLSAAPPNDNVKKIMRTRARSGCGVGWERNNQGRCVPH